MIKIKDSVEDFFKWVKGSELVELDDIDVSEDPVRPELTLGFRIMHGRKVFGLKYNDEIEAIVCTALCPEVPHTVREMDYMSQVANQDGQRGEIVVAYTVWSRKKGAGKEIIKKLGEWAKAKSASSVFLKSKSPFSISFTNDSFCSRFLYLSWLK